MFADGQCDEMASNQAVQLEELFFVRMDEFLTRTLGEGELTPVEKRYWIQSGLELSPLMATCTHYFLDFCLAWALIGEWTSRMDQGRSFEQGALPSLLLP